MSLVMACHIPRRGFAKRAANQSVRTGNVGAVRIRTAGIVQKFRGSGTYWCTRR